MTLNSILTEKDDVIIKEFIKHISREDRIILCNILTGKSLPDIAKILGENQELLKITLDEILSIFNYIKYEIENFNFIDEEECALDGTVNELYKLIHKNKLSDIRIDKLLQNINLEQYSFLGERGIEFARLYHRGREL